MDIFKAAERSMAMDDAVWARHANHWSVWTRIPILPLMALAIWSRMWIGWWCLVPIALLIGWALFNPRAFPAPEPNDGFSYKGVFGERYFLARKQMPIPRHHHRWGIGLTIVSAIGVPPLIYGLWVFNAWAVVLGLTLTVGAKIWFVDRMGWLYEDMQRPQ